MEGGGNKILWVLLVLWVKVRKQLESNEKTNSSRLKVLYFLGQAYLEKQLLEDALNFFRLGLKEIDEQSSEHQAFKALIYSAIGSVLKFTRTI